MFGTLRVRRPSPAPPRDRHCFDHVLATAGAGIALLAILGSRLRRACQSRRRLHHRPAAGTRVNPRRHQHSATSTAPRNATTTAISIASLAIAGMAACTLIFLVA